MMFKLPPEFSGIISALSPLFSNSVFDRASQLLLGAILTQGKRTVCGVLRTLGLSHITNWDLYHRVLGRAKWSALACSRQILAMLIKRFAKGDTLVFGIDETLERRWGPKIKARGIYRDAVRSSKSHLVKSSGLRWICPMLLSPIGWAHKTWALPFLAVLAPSRRYHGEQGKMHKKVSDWARQVCFLLHRWLPGFRLIMLGDGAYSVLGLLSATCGHVTWITRFRMDAALYDRPPSKKRPGPGRPASKGKKQVALGRRLHCPSTRWEKTVFSHWYGERDKPMEIASGTALWYRSGESTVSLRWILIRDPGGKLDPMALQCTDASMDPVEIVRHYLKRWQVEVTFEEIRAHLGVETQRQWSDLAILRTTPSLMALFSLVALWADTLNDSQELTVPQAAWHQKPHPTFSDAIASVRYRIWKFQFSARSLENSRCAEINQDIIEHLAFMAARAA